MDIKTITDTLMTIHDEKDLTKIYKIISAFVGNQISSNEFQKYYEEITSEQYQLLIKFYEYEQEYFEDMMLSENSIMADVSEIAKENFDYIPLGLEYANIRFYYVNSSDFLGCFYCYERKIEIVRGIAPEEEKGVILHEMIHFYEWELENRFPAAKELLTLRLYNYLLSKVENLEELILRHCNLFEQEETFNKGESGTHGLLFYLKSLELDIRCGYSLGTICGYRRNEWE